MATRRKYKDGDIVCFERDGVAVWATIDYLIEGTKAYRVQMTEYVEDRFTVVLEEDIQKKETK